MYSGFTQREMKRVLKPDGALLFVEHGLVPDAAVRRWQYRLDPMWKRLAGGCHLDRKMDALISAAGFTLVELQKDYAKGPPNVGCSRSELPILGPQHLDARVVADCVIASSA